MKRFLVYRRQSLLGSVGGFMAILGYLSPFGNHRSFFTLLDETSVPFLARGLLLLVVAVIILYSLEFVNIPLFLSMELFLFLCLVYGTLIYLFPISFLLDKLQIGAYLLPLGLLAMILHPLALPDDT